MWENTKMGKVHEKRRRKDTVGNNPRQECRLGLDMRSDLRKNEGGAK